MHRFKSIALAGRFKLLCILPPLYSFATGPKPPGPQAVRVVDHEAEQCAFRAAGDKPTADTPTAAKLAADPLNAFSPSPRAVRMRAIAPIRNANARGRVLLGAGVARMMLEQPETAAAHLDGAVQMRPSCGRTLFTRAVLHLNGQRWQVLPHPPWSPLSPHRLRPLRWPDVFAPASGLLTSLAASPTLASHPWVRICSLSPPLLFARSFRPDCLPPCSLPPSSLPRTTCSRVYPTTKRSW